MLSRKLSNPKWQGDLVRAKSLKSEVCILDSSVRGICIGPAINSGEGGSVGQPTRLVRLRMIAKGRL